MKKILKSRIFTIIITTIVVASGTLYAATLYNATDISYKPSSGESMNVNEALDDLYAKSKENDDKYKVYSFTNEDATVSGTHADYTDGKWIVMSYQKTTNCSGGSCDYEGGYVSFEMDLGFTPSEVSNAQIYLTPTKFYDDPFTYGFRYSRGYSAASSSATANYWYTRSLMATYPNDICYFVVDGGHHLLTTTDTTGSGSEKTTYTWCENNTYHGEIYGSLASNNSTKTYTSVEISGSKLIFKVNVKRMLTTNGTSNSAFYVKTFDNAFYLSGTIVYK